MIDLKRRRIALLVAGCFFMEYLDITIVTTAAPRLGQALHVSSVSVSVLISAYLITFAVVIPFGSWLVTRWDERTVFASAIAIFTLASLWCALSTSFWELVTARAVQGVGAALMVPVGRLAVLANAAKVDVIRLIAYVVWPALVAPVIAPFLGGVIVSVGSWRWIFVLNLPFGVAAFTLAMRWMPHTSAATSRVRLDWVGMLLTSTSLGGLVYVGYLASTPSVAWTDIVELGTLFALILAAAVVHLLHSQRPFIDLRVLHVTTLRQSLLGIALFTLAVGSVPMLLPLLFQDVFGWSPILSGALVVCVFVGNIGAKPFTTRLLNRFGHRVVLIGATLGAALTLIAFSQITVTMALAVIGCIAVANGVVRSIGFTAYMTLTYADVRDEHMNHANTLAATVQQVFAGFAISAGAVSLRVGADMAGTPASSTSEPFKYAFALLAVVAVTATFGAVPMHSSAGDTLRSVDRSLDVRGD
jgi:EmrB/QacA subfamily drug resistance transporter